MKDWKSTAISSVTYNGFRWVREGAMSTEAGRRLLAEVGATGEPWRKHMAETVVAIEAEARIAALRDLREKVGAILTLPSFPRKWYCAECGCYEPGPHRATCRSAAVLAIIDREVGG